MDKRECMINLNVVRSSYAMGILASSIIPAIDNYKIPSIIPLKNLKTPGKEYRFNISQLKQFLNNDQIRIQVVSEFVRSIVRTFILDMYEVVLSYAKKTKQQASFYDSELIYFLRLLRNNVGHEHVFRFRNKKDRQRLSSNPVSWRDKEISLKMEGKMIPIDMIDPANVILLFDDLLNYVKKELK